MITKHGLLTSKPQQEIPNPNASTPDVYTTAVTCPQCSSARIRIDKTMPAEADGSILRYAVCLACSARFKVISEA